MKIVVVGSGPAGLMAAIAAAEGGARVTVLEQLGKPGCKLLATGGGRCNLTNTASTEALLEAFGRNGRFMRTALFDFDSDALQSFLAERGVPTAYLDGFHIFPRSERAGDVLSALLTTCENLGVEICCGVHVDDLVLEDGAVAGVCAGDRRWPCGGVVLAAGGRGYSSLGGGMSGYELAEMAGHAIVPPVPGLVAIDTEEGWPGRCAGIVLPGVELLIDRKRERKRVTRGELLFTHSGISGPAAIDLSGRVNALLREGGAVPLVLRPWPTVSETEWLSRFEEWVNSDPKRSLLRHLSSHMPKALASELLIVAGGKDLSAVRAAEFPGTARRALAAALCGIPLTVTRTSDFERAMVTRGGVDLKEVDPRRLESRLCRGLFFAGEVLDLDGPCGGYNLQWAFSSGRLAGTAVAAMA
ncbi:MAG: BaiN/RdsA family NAD(P)/FAD-dependent oxidoreductase [Planctomycetota bacterium]|jgi:predicted Rossmann fold flavoprotein